MTIELGNINKGIPMGSYTPGEGGGAAKVTGVDPIAVTNGSVAIKIDEQTLQVNEQGELSANLDEIGSELNDLSGRVTAAEADILEKQGKLTARNPITIRTKEITNAKGFNTGTSTAATAQNVQKIWMSTSQNSGTIYIDSTFTLPIASYIAMPYTPGQIVKAPKSNAALAFGSFDDDNNFKLSLLFDLNYTSTSGFQLLGGPIYKTSSAATKDVLPNLDMTDFVYANGYGWRTRPTEAADSGDIYSTVSDEDKQCAFFQVSSDSANALFIQEFWNLTNSRASTAVHRDSETGFAFAGHCDEIRENINTALFLPMDTASSHDLTKLGVYNAPSDRMAWSSGSAWKSFRENKGTNFFNLGGTGVHNYLELNIGNGLGIQDNKLVNTLKIPDSYTKTETDTLLDAKASKTDLANKQDKSNAVTIDAKQTISGQKEFDKTILLLSNNDFLRGQQSTSYRNGAGLSMGSNSTSTDGGPFTPQWKIYNTSGNVDRTETIITTYNQSKLNSANFNAASKLVRLDSDGKLPAIDGSKLTNLPSGSTSAEKYGLEGDYCSKYGIVDCPNGILEESTGQVTLKAGVVMQMTETDGLTTNASDMPHDITSTVDFDLFYTSGSLLEATQVVFSEQEPEDGATGVLAWYNGTQWKFKSNDAGNVWRTAPAVRLAHFHITDGNITRIDYIGNRHLNKVIPVTTNTAQTISGDKTLTGITTISNDMKIPIGQKITTPDGQWLMRFWTGFIGLGTSARPLTTYDGANYYLHNKSVIAGDGIKITEPSTDNIKISSTSPTPIRYPVEVSDKSLMPSWYVVYNDGWCEQGGFTTKDEAPTSLLKSYKDTNYSITLTSKISTGDHTASASYTSKAVSSFTVDYTNTALGVDWECRGYIN